MRHNHLKLYTLPLDRDAPNVTPATGNPAFSWSFPLYKVQGHVVILPSSSTLHSTPVTVYHISVTSLISGTSFKPTRERLYHQHVSRSRSFYAAARDAACSLETGPEQPETTTLPAGYVPPISSSIPFYVLTPTRRKAQNRGPVPPHLAERPSSCLDDCNRRRLH